MEGMSNTTISTDVDRRALARFFRVLSDPTRLQILGLLSEQALTVTELVDRLDMPRSRVSNHLACLRHCLFVDCEPEGRSVRYRLAGGDLDALLREASEVAECRAEHLASCDRIGPQWL